jgi:hypothetical protein
MQTSEHPSSGCARDSLPLAEYQRDFHPSTRSRPAYGQVSGFKQKVDDMSSRLDDCKNFKTRCGSTVLG